MKQAFKQSIEINTQKLSKSGLLLSLMIIFSLLSHLLNISIFPAAGFLKIEIVDFIVLISYRIVGLPYTIILIILNSTLRIFYNSDDPISALSIFMADTLFVLSFAISELFFYRMLNLNKKNNKAFLIFLISGLIAILFVSFTMTLMNYLFIFRLYILYLKLPSSSLDSFNKLLIPFVLPFNIIKFTINLLIIIFSYNVFALLNSIYGQNMEVAYSIKKLKKDTNQQQSC